MHPHDGGTVIAERGIFSTCAAAHATAARHPTFSANGTTATERRQHEVKCGCPDMAHPMPSRSPTSRRKPTSNFPTPREHWRRRAWERSLRFRDLSRNGGTSGARTRRRISRCCASMRPLACYYAHCFYAMRRKTHKREGKLSCNVMQIAQPIDRALQSGLGWRASSRIRRSCRNYPRPHTVSALRRPTSARIASRPGVEVCAPLP